MSITELANRPRSLSDPDRIDRPRRHVRRDAAGGGRPDADRGRSPRPRVRRRRQPCRSIPVSAGQGRVSPGGSAARSVADVWPLPPRSSRASAARDGTPAVMEAPVVAREAPVVVASPGRRRRSPGRGASPGRGEAPVEVATPAPVVPAVEPGPIVATTPTVDAVPSILSRMQALTEPVVAEAPAPVATSPIMAPEATIAARCRRRASPALLWLRLTSLPSRWWRPPRLLQPLSPRRRWRRSPPRVRPWPSTSATARTTSADRQWRATSPSPTTSTSPPTWPVPRSRSRSVTVRPTRPCPAPPPSPRRTSW